MSEIAAQVEAQSTGATVQKRLLMIFIAIAIGVGAYLLPTPEGLSQTGHIYLALLAGLLILFLTEPIPLPLVMVVSGVALIVLGIGETREVWAGYAHPVVFFVLGCLMIAIVAESVGLTERLGRFILRYTGTNVVRFSFISCFGLGDRKSVV